MQTFYQDRERSLLLHNNDVLLVDDDTCLQNIRHLAPDQVVALLEAIGRKLVSINLMLLLDADDLCEETDAALKDR